MQFDITVLLDLIGTFAFAISGIRLASGKQIDWFGAYITGLVTAVGGGTFRDLMLGHSPFWMLDSKYLLTTAAALLVTLLFKSRLFKWGSTLFLFDSIGLGLFTVIGITKSIDAGFPFWVSIIMGAMSGALGGVIRDVLLNEVPLIFRRDIYALACIVGGGVYFICSYFKLSTDITEIIAASTVIIFRLIAVKFHIHLPQLEAIKKK